jgi:transposase
MWKVQSGMTTKEVAEFLGKTEKTVRLWKRAYESDGLSALLGIAEGRGRKAKVVEATVLQKHIEEMQNTRKGGRIKCKDVVQFVDNKYGVKYSVSGMYKVLHRLDFVWITSRSKHPKHNQQAQDEFKKTSRKSPRNYPRWNCARASRRMVSR